MTWQRVPLIIAGVGWIGLLGTVVLTARYQVDELGSGLVFNWVLGTGMITSGLLLLSGAIAAEYLVLQGVLTRGRRNSIFFRTTGVIGVVAILYGVATMAGG
jgi:hypothetical protein